MLLTLFAIGYSLYAGAFYYYSTRLFGTDTKIKYGIATLFNTFLYLYYIFYVSFKYEYIALFILFALYFAQVKIIFKQSTTTVLFRALTLALHVIAMRMIIIGTYALSYDITIAQLAENQELRIITTTVLFFITIPYVLIVGIIFKKTGFAEVIKKGKSIQFSLVVLSTIFAYCLATTFFLYNLQIDDDKAIILVIKTGVCSLIGFFVCFIYDYMFTILDSHKDKFESLSEALEAGKEEYRKLSDEANIDSFTSLKVRDVAYTRIEHFLSDQEPFYVTFIDMDGLKTVNDTYGHNEGDFYILSVANILKEVYKNATIARVGGDEFIIVDKALSPYDAQDKANIAGEKISLISRESMKPYLTSASYGICYVDDYTLYSTADDIIKTADIKMYEHKRRMKKERVVVKPS